MPCRIHSPRTRGPRLFLAAMLVAATAAAVSPEVARRYVRETLWHRAPFATASADLRGELDGEITRLLDLQDAGGRLKPSYFSVGITESWLLHGYPGEQILVLSEALPFLPPASRARVQAHLFDAIRDYDPTANAFDHCDWGWGSCELTGHRREFFPLPASPNPDPLAPNLWPPPAVPPECLYVVWRYADATGDWDFISETTPASGERWSRLVARFNAISNPPVRYGEIAAAIGFARILTRFGMTNDPLHAAALDRIQTGMLAGTDFSAFLERSQQEFFLGTHDWAWTPFHYLRNANAVGAMLAPETGRFLREFALAEVHRRTTLNPLEDEPGEIPAVESNWAGWYLTRGYYPPLIPWTGHYGENHMVTPDTPWAVFMTRAWVYGDSGDDLRRYLDVPYSIGDLFHIQRLVAAIGAYADPLWSPVQPPRMAAPESVPGGLVVSADGGADGLYVLERSTDLAAWEAISTNAGPAFSITNAGLGIFQFFRAKVAP